MRVNQKEGGQISIRFAHVADFHLGYEQYGLEQRHQDFATAFYQAARKTVELGLKVMLVAGDLFHVRNLNPKTLTQAVSVLKYLREEGVLVIAVEGNHDTPGYDGFSWFDYLQAEGYLLLLSPVYEEGKVSFGLPYKIETEVAGRPSDRAGRKLPEGRVGCVELNGCCIYGVGYLGASLNTLLPSIVDAIKADDYKGPKVLLMHAGVEGFIPHLTGLNATALNELRKAVDYLALGHIHIGYGVDNFAYNPGAVEPANISEFDREQGLLEVSFDASASPDGQRYVPVVKRHRLSGRLFLRQNIDCDALKSRQEFDTLICSSAEILEEEYENIDKAVYTSVKSFTNPYVS
ncbi:MAG: exonuclease SbcCD subunit D, partial [Thermoplasmata archaeon]